MRKHYRIGKISSLMGISSEAIRYYEREGIITPQKDNCSGYRAYTAWDLHFLIRTRMFRKYGYSLLDTTKALQEPDMNEVVKSLSEKEVELEESIRHQNHILEQLRSDKHMLQDCSTNVNKFRLAYSPTMAFIDTQRSYEILDEKVDLYRSWIDRVPYAASGGVFDLAEPGKSNLRYGLVIDIRNIEAGSLEKILQESGNETKDVEIIPSQRCLNTFFLSGSDKELCIDMFQPSFDFMKRHGLTATSFPFARMVHMSKQPNGEYVSIYQAWTPCEGEIEYCEPMERDKDKPSEFI